MLFTHVVSEAPVPAVCQVLRPFQAELNRANGSKSAPKQVCDSSTCVFTQAFASVSHAQIKSLISGGIKKDLSAPGRPSDSRNTHLFSPGDADMGWMGFRHLRLLVSSQPIDDNCFFDFMFI